MPERKVAQITLSEHDHVPNLPSFYQHGQSRFVVTIAIGYGEGISDDTITPEQAVLAALDLVSDIDTVWTVLDRRDGRVTMWRDLGEAPEPVTEARELATKLGDAGKLDENEADRLAELVQGFTREQVLAFVAPANPCPRCGLDPNSDDARDFGPREDK